MTDKTNDGVTPSNEELLPCPFCGNGAQVTRSYDADGALWCRVACNSCGAQTRGKWVSHHSNTCQIFYAEVRDEWNTRTPSQQALPIGEAASVPAKPYAPESFEKPIWQTLQAIGQEMVANHPELDEEQTPEPVQRLLCYAGKQRREVSNPCITAREAIEIANWIQAAAYGRGQQSMPKQAAWLWYTPAIDGTWNHHVGLEKPKRGAHMLQPLYTLPEPPTC